MLCVFASEIHNFSQCSGCIIRGSPGKAQTTCCICRGSPKVQPLLGITPTGPHIKPLWESPQGIPQGIPLGVPREAPPWDSPKYSLVGFSQGIPPGPWGHPGGFPRLVPLGTTIPQVKNIALFLQASLTSKIRTQMRSPHSIQTAMRPSHRFKDLGTSADGLCLTSREKVEEITYYNVQVCTNFQQPISRTTIECRQPTKA